MKEPICLFFVTSLLCTTVVRTTFGQSRQIASDDDVQRILRNYQTTLPAESDLGVFKLDWASSLAEAKVRAAKENRPIFFVSTVQTKDAGNLRNGHC